MKTPQAFSSRKVRQMAQGRSHAAVLLVLLAAWPSIFFTTPAAAGELACGTARATGCEAWTAIFSDGDAGEPRVAQTPDGSAVLVVANNVHGGASRFTINAYDPFTGALLWNTTYEQRNGPLLRSIAVSPDSTQLYIVGSTDGGALQFSRALILAYDARDGTALWSHQWDPGSMAYAVTPSPDGARVYITGWKYLDFLTAAFDAQTGALLWETGYDNHGGKAADRPYDSEDIGYDLATTSDGSALFVVGHSAAADGTMEYVTVKYDAATGNATWVQRHRASGVVGTAHSGGFDLALAPDGERLYVLGSDGILAYDPTTGAELWPSATQGAACRQYWSESPLEGECDLEISPDGQRLFVGTHNNLAGYDAAEGALLWTFPLSLGDEDAKTGLNIGNGMVMSPDGSRLYAISKGGRDPKVTSSISAINSNYETIAIDTTNGLPLWRVVYDRAWEQVFSLDLSPDGKRIFVAGESEIRLPADLALVAYDADMGLENLPELTI